MQLGEYGALLRFTTGLDLTNATTLLLRIQRPPPDNSTFDRALGVESIIDAPHGIVTYQLASGDLSRVGVYRVQAFDTSNGQNLPSAITTFVVEPNLPAPI